jgi:hypothetical protein
MPLRPLTKGEETLLSFLISQSTIKITPEWKGQLLVSAMDDGGMGSLLLFPQGKQTRHRQFGQTVAEYQFKDADGTEVLAALNVDQNGELFELDIWKTNFDPLLQFPTLLP